MTLALYGKSRKRKGWLLLAAFLAIVVAAIGGGTFVNGGALRATAQVPTQSVTFVKVICPSYSLVPANVNPTNIDQTGGHANDLASGHTSKPVTQYVPAGCALAPGWSFNTFSGWNNVATAGGEQPTGPLGGPYTTGAGGAVTVTLSTAELAAARSGNGLWVTETRQDGVATFGSLRCYNDILNGDNLERIDLAAAGTSGVMCVAYNVDLTPHVLLSKGHTPTGDITAGTAFTWDITATVSNGPVTSNIVLKDTIPAAFAIGALPSGCTAIAQAVTCTLTATAQTGTGTHTFSIPVTAPAKTTLANCTSYQNIVTGSYGDVAPIVIPSASDTVNVVGCSQPQTLSPGITKTIDTGAGHPSGFDSTSAYWKIHIANGNNSGISVTITDSGTTKVSDAPSLACSAASPYACSVAANSFTDLVVSEPLSSGTFPNGTCKPGTIDNQAITAAWSPPGSTDTQPVQVTKPALPIQLPGIVSSGCLSIAKTSSNNGNANNYTITITNTGPQASVLVKDAFNAGGTGASLVDPVTTGGSFVGTCNVAILTGAGCVVVAAANTTTTVSVNSTSVSNTTCGTETVSNTATGNLTNADRTALGALGVTAGASNTVSRDYPGVTCVPGLTISKSGTTSVSVGGGVSYTVTVGNSGTSATSGTITMTDQAPAGLTGVAASGTGWICSVNGSNLVTCTYTNAIPSGGAAPPITITGQAPVATCGTLHNVASVTGGGDSQTHTSSPSVDTTVVNCTGTLTVTKIVLGDPGNTGRFDLKIDGSTLAGAVGNGGTTGAVTVSAGAHTVSEAATSSATDLSQYSSVASCSTGATGTTSAAVTVGIGANVVCTITNTKIQPPIINPCLFGGCAPVILTTPTPTAPPPTSTTIPVIITNVPKKQPTSAPTAVDTVLGEKTPGPAASGITPRPAERRQWLLRQQQQELEPAARHPRDLRSEWRARDPRVTAAGRRQTQLTPATDQQRERPGDFPRGVLVFPQTRSDSTWRRD
jgi:uncharacterized repeat protein (TIGR01451 family)